MTATRAVKLGTRHRHYIGGEWVEPESAEVVPIIYAATGEVVDEVPRATVAEANRAVEAARTAFDEGSWATASGQERATVIRQLADALWERRDHILELAVRQGGCVVSQRGTQIEWPIQTLYRSAQLAETPFFEHVDMSGGPFRGGTGHPHGWRIPGIGHTVSIREPIGVVAAITPFNYPFLMNLMKLGGALAAGCTVVLKPTEYTCLDAIEIARVLDEETDIPKGVVNVLLGAYGHDVGEAIVSHPMVDMISFTGSTATGRRIMATAAPTVKKVSLELGGKSANVIFADADLDKALAVDCALVIRHAGQACSHLSRVLVEESIHDEVVERMLARASTVVVGDPLDPQTEMGPLASKAQWDRVDGYVQSGIEQGATLRRGGTRPPGFERGYFMEPTIFTDVRPDMRIFQEEIFGPVVSVTAFNGEDEAVKLANDTIYGLYGAVWSRDFTRAMEVASRLRTGNVQVNGPGSANWEAPYGGYKQSGIGRDWGQWAVEECSEIKTLRYNAY